MINQRATNRTQKKKDVTTLYHIIRPRYRRSRCFLEWFKRLSILFSTIYKSYLNGFQSKSMLMKT